MKTIGLIGGMSWESSARILPHHQPGASATGSAAALGAMPDVVGRLRRDRGAAARGALGRGGAGAWRARRSGWSAAAPTSVLICTNTMHRMADEIAAARRRSRCCTSPIRRPSASGAPGIGASACSAPPSRWSRTSTRAGSAPERARRAGARRGGPSAGPSGDLRRAGARAGRAGSRDAYRAMITRLVERGAEGDHPRLHRDHAAGRARGQPRCRCSTPRPSMPRPPWSMR